MNMNTLQKEMHDEDISAENIIRMDKDSVGRLRDLLEWRYWKLQKTDDLTNNQNIVEVLRCFRHCITQGAGIGSLVSLIGMLNCFDLPEEATPVLDEIKTTKQGILDWVNGLDRIVSLVDKDYEISELSFADVESCLTEANNQVEQFRNIKGQTVYTGNSGPDCRIKANPELLGIVFREVLTNSFKYSPENSKIQSFFYSSGDYLLFCMLNDIQDMGLGTKGIPKENEQSIFEPFFRVNNTVDERYFAEEIGIGLGLTVVRKLINQLGGRLSMFEICDYAFCKETYSQRVMTEITIPTV